MGFRKQSPCILSALIVDKLKENLELCYDDAFMSGSGNCVVRQSDRDTLRKHLGVIPAESAFIDFYCVVAFPPVGNGPELYTIEHILALMGVKGPELVKRNCYICFSAIESGFSYFYNRETDEVFDCARGDEGRLVNGDLSVGATFSTFHKFLEWYYLEV